MLVLLSYPKLQTLPPQCMVRKQLNVWVKDMNQKCVAKKKEKTTTNGQGYSVAISGDGGRWVGGGQRRYRGINGDGGNFFKKRKYVPIDGHMLKDSTEPTQRL